MIASWAMIRENRQDPGDGRDGRLRRRHRACSSPAASPAAMAEAARLAVDRGADLIDINFGCPVKKVALGQQAGSALMRDEAAAAAILEATVKAVAVPVTLKMRMGWDHASLNAPRLARIAQDCGIRMVTVHGRTRQQFYTGTADWDFIRQVKDAVGHPGHRQRRHPDRGGCRRGAAPLGRRRRDDRPRLLRPAVVPRPGRALPAHRPAPARAVAGRAEGHRAASIIDAMLEHFGDRAGRPPGAQARRPGTRAACRVRPSSARR